MRTIVLIFNKSNFLWFEEIVTQSVGFRDVLNLLLCSANIDRHEKLKGVLCHSMVFIEFCNNIIVILYNIVIILLCCFKNQNLVLLIIQISKFLH